MRSGSLPPTTKTKSGRSSAARGAAAAAEWRSCRWRRSARRTVLDDHHKTENAGSGWFRPDSKENREELGRCPPNPTVREACPRGPWLASPAENRGKLPGQSERYWLERSCV